MTKTLTEQWRNGTLESGMYYWKLPNNETFMATLYKMDEYKQTKDASQIVCLAHVPDYDQFSQLVKKVEQLEQQMKEAENVIQLYFKNTQNAIYQSLGMNDGYYKKAFIHTVVKEYLEKWGVK